MDPMVVFTPVVEPDLPGAFITKHPRDEKAESSLEIPFLTGVTYDEGLMKSLRKFIYHTNWLFQLKSNTFLHQLFSTVPVYLMNLSET